VGGLIQGTEKSVLCGLWDMAHNIVFWTVHAEFDFGLVQEVLSGIFASRQRIKSEVAPLPPISLGGLGSAEALPRALYRIRITLSGPARRYELYL
jgi:hypothetical protein